VLVFVIGIVERALVLFTAASMRSVSNRSSLYQRWHALKVRRLMDFFRLVGWRMSYKRATKRLFSRHLVYM
jgi:hypothetical protein